MWIDAHKTLSMTTLIQACNTRDASAMRCVAALVIGAAASSLVTHRSLTFCRDGTHPV